MISYNLCVQNNFLLTIACTCANLVIAAQICLGFNPLILPHMLSLIAILNEFKNLHWVKKLKRNMYAEGHRYETVYADKHGNEL